MVTELENADALLELIDKELPDLIILDVRMPGKDGLSALRELRQKYAIPVIMLTAASEVIDKVLGLELGADDYLVKPVDLREFQARVKAAIRRGNIDNASDAVTAFEENIVMFGSFKLHMNSSRLYDKDDNEIPITAMEYSLLRVFASNKGRILNRDQLLEQAHDRGWEPFDRSIDLRISRIRKKLEKNPTKPEIIRTVRGLGYIFG